MSRPAPRRFSSPVALAEEIVSRAGEDIRLALPLGLGKANHVVNALYQLAYKNDRIRLTIYTALSLEKPRAGSDLQRRFLEPLQERFYKDYPELLYVEALRDGSLPENIQVKEFFLTPGRWLKVAPAQQNYQSVNYTFVLPALLRAEINVLAQLLAPAPAETDQRFSLSCNPDISVDLLKARASGKIDFLAVGQVNAHLPFMAGEAIRPMAEFDLLLDGEEYQYPLFSLPQEPVSLQDHAIGLQVARLVPDGGTLQIGIGSIGDAVCHALRLRQKENETFRRLLDQLEARCDDLPCCDGPFTTGLYSASEMLVEGFPALLESGVLKREVDGIILHAGFYLGSKRFYQALENMPETLRDKIAMMPITFTNTLYGDEEQRRQDRKGARFINSAMMVTLLGAVVSDGLDNGQVVSGVGGQYNFVAMAAALDDARSIIVLPATRVRHGQAQSNIVWNYAHQTIPRHLRDMVVTEYGVADLRDKSDADVIIALLKITDSRFQQTLLKTAQEAGKLPGQYQLPTAFRQNLPGCLSARLSKAHQTGSLPVFPLGSDYTPVEERLLPALKLLRALSGAQWQLLRMTLKGWRPKPSPAEQECLERLALAQPQGLREKFLRQLVLEALRRTKGLSN